MLPFYLANLRWLSGYRHPRCGCGLDVASVLGVLESNSALTICGLAARVGDPLVELPTIFHLLWVPSCPMRASWFSMPNPCGGASPVRRSCLNRYGPWCCSVLGSVKLTSRRFSMVFPVMRDQTWPPGPVTT